MFLQLTGLKKLYDADNGVKCLNLSVEEGTFVTLLGPSGCGKTTTLNLIGGFLKADEGSILLDGQDITHLPPEERPISTVFQSYALFPHLDVLQNVCYGLRFLKRMSRREAEPVARRFLDTVGLSGYERARVGNLSGGQQQRVALARAMAPGPKILLLDEPLSNLDAGLRSRMREELKQLQKRLGITMVFVTHDQEEALCLSDQIVVMNRGEAAQVGTPKEIYCTPISEYVSSFVGRSNYIQARGGTVLVRPEDISMQPSPDGAYRIQTCTFMGAHTDFVLEGPEGRLTVSVPGTGGPLTPGQRVKVQILRQYPISER